MKKMLVALLVAAGFTASALASPITFIFTGNGGSGTLDGVPFGGVDFTITATGDTDDRVVLGAFGFRIPNLTASILMSGVGTFDFITATNTFVNNTVSTPGLVSSAGDLYTGPTNAVFAAWDMLSSIGPVAGAMSLVAWSLAPVDTSGGVLVFDPMIVSGSFQAIVGQDVPEPGTLALFALALFALALLRARAPMR